MNPPSGSLFDHLVGAGEQRRRHVERQGAGSAEINHQLELRWQLNRQIARFFALENATSIDAQDPIAFLRIRSIAHESPDGGKFTAEVEGWHGMTRRKHDDLACAIEKERIDGSQLTQQLEPLRLELGLKPARTGEIAAGSMQAGNQPAAE